ncbi:MAG: sugar O-acetyltransferase [Oscillospiraceae bacterium]|nr:sugar O-acetyltransferase [Oscillospiraceae bacterium]
MDNLTRKQNEQPYIADEHCAAQMRENARRLYEYNNGDRWSDEGLKKQDERIRAILGKAGKNLAVMPPFHCDYGYNIAVGDNFYSNYNLIILDVAPVTIGNNVFIAPNVAIYTAGHPIHHKARNSMFEYGISITIGDNCWIGGNTVICPGVKIGSGVVIGAGSVVTHDIPDNTVAAGNPCKVLREITDNDLKYYFKKREFSADELDFIEGAK